MMIKPTLAIFAIVAIAAMMGASTIAPAYAATLLENVNTNRTIGPFPYPVEICGVESALLTVTIKENFKAWDNGKSNRHTITDVIVTDEDGNTIGTSKGTRSEIGEFDVYPLKFIIEDHNKASCTNGESDENFEVDTKEGSTTFRSESGEITHQSNHHG